MPQVLHALGSGPPDQGGPGGKIQARIADLFDRAVKTTAYAISDYRTTPDLAARLMEASGTASPAAPPALGRLGRMLARKRRRSASRNDNQ